MNYKAIIFDFDGVLFDSEKIHLQACNQVSHTLGFTLSKEEYFQHYVGLSDQEMLNLILKNKNLSCTIDQSQALRRNKMDAYQAIINQYESLDGVAGVKGFLESNKELINSFAICSGGTREEVIATLNKLEHGEIKQYFKYIITVDDVSAGKPSPEGYLLTAQRLNILPQHCLVIEDTPVGITAARNAGMDVIGITTSHPKSALKQATFIADDYAEINSWINS